MWNVITLLENVESIFFNALVTFTKSLRKQLKGRNSLFCLTVSGWVYHERIMVVRTGLMEATITWSIWSHKSSVRKQREINVGAIVDFSFCTFYSVLGSFCGIVLPTLGTGLPFLVKPFWKWPQGPIKRTVSWIILNPIKLAMKVNNHSFQKLQIDVDLELLEQWHCWMFWLWSKHNVLCVVPKKIWFWGHLCYTYEFSLKDSKKNPATITMWSRCDDLDWTI